MRGDKQPYVRFFPSDWLGGTRGMRAIESGVYITLIALMYERCEPLPDDRRRLARQCGCSEKAFTEILDGLIADSKVIVLGGGLWNDRVQREFNFRVENSNKAREAANARWENHNKNSDPNMQQECESNASGMLFQKPESRSQKPELERLDLTTFGLALSAACAAARAQGPEFIRIPTNKFEKRREEITIFEGNVLEFEGLYPDVDVRAQLRAMRGWSISNKEKRKTAKGMMRFVNRWLADKQDKGSNNGTNGYRNGQRAQQSASGSFAAGISEAVDARARGDCLFGGEGEGDCGDAGGKITQADRDGAIEARADYH